MLNRNMHKRSSEFVGNLISIINDRGRYFFSRFGDSDDESPILKVKKHKNHYGKVHFQLVVMEVLFPEPLYSTGSPRQNTLHAIRDGCAVVRETTTVISFMMNPGYRTEEVTLKEVDDVDDLEVEPSVKMTCVCQESCHGCVEVSPSRHSKQNLYRFFVTGNSIYGKVELDIGNGTWIYTSQSKDPVEDSFEITVWDELGAFATQMVTIQCESYSHSETEHLYQKGYPMDSDSEGAMNFNHTSRKQSEGKVVADLLEEGKRFMSIPILSPTAYSTGIYRTSAVDVSLFQWYTYAIYVSGKGTVILQEEVGANDAERYFFPVGNAITLTGMSATCIQRNPPILQYSQLSLSVESGEYPTVEIILQGQY